MGQGTMEVAVDLASLSATSNMTPRCPPPFSSGREFVDVPSSLGTAHRLECTSARTMQVCKTQEAAGRQQDRRRPPPSGPGLVIALPYLPSRTSTHDQHDDNMTRNTGRGYGSLPSKIKWSRNRQRLMAVVCELATLYPRRAPSTLIFRAQTDASLWPGLEGRAWEQRKGL